MSKKSVSSLDQSPRSNHFPTITSSLILLNLGTFLYELLLSNRQLAVFFERWAFIPGQFVTNSEWATLLTGLFLHAGWTHLLGNLLYLWLFGSLCETHLGHKAVLLLYLTSGILATLTQFLIEPFAPVPIIGASGAVAGLLGASFALLNLQQKQPSANTRFSISLFFFSQKELPVILIIAVWFVWQFLNGLAQVGSVQLQLGSEAFFAHVGGFIVGSLFIRFLNKNKPLPLS